MPLSKCIPCLQGLPEFCMTGGNCDKPDAGNPLDDVSEILSDSPEEDYELRPERLRKNASNLKDPASTGRKEAARLYPLNKDADCEWAFIRSAGGGKHPIQGCAIRFGSPNKQVNRHHGPDKNTMNNTPGNVHRICAHCHNRWHAANDEEYDPEKVDAE